MEATGAHQHLLFTGGSLTHRSLEGYEKYAPGWSSDGASILFYDSAFQPTRAWKVSLASGIVSRIPMPYSCVGGCGGGPVCKLPLYSQHYYAWASIVMQYAKQTIDADGCALTSLTMLFDYYGSNVGNPGGMASCLNPWNAADPVDWYEAQVNKPGGPGCDNQTTSFINSTSFSWSTVDTYLKAGHPVISEVCLDAPNNPCYHTHWFVIVSGDGSDNMNGYLINDPDDGNLDVMNKYASWRLNWMIQYIPNGSWPPCE